MTFAATQTLEGTDREPGKEAAGRFRWVILAILFGATTIGYMDRFLLGILKPSIMHDLRWTETDYANVIFCFQLAYAVGLLSVSRLIDRIGVRTGMLLVVGTCALASASHSLVSTTLGFCMARIALGFGEAGTFPGCVKTIGEWFPSRERALGNGVVNAGSSIGATLTPIVVSLLLKIVAWPLTFLFIAALDLVWCVVWLIGYRPPDRHPWLKKAELAYIRSDPNVATRRIPWLQLFQHRQTWAFFFAKGLSDPVWWFFLFWVPGYLAKEYGHAGESAVSSAANMALPITAIYLMASIGSISGGWLAIRLARMGWSVNRARKTVMLGCAFCVAPVFLVSFHLGLWQSVFLIGLAAAAHLAFSASLFTVVTDTVPKDAVSSVAGIGGMGAALFAMCNAKLIGFVLDTTHSYFIPFAMASCAYFVALGILHLLLPRLEPMKVEGLA